MRVVVRVATYLLLVVGLVAVGIENRRLQNNIDGLRGTVNSLYDDLGDAYEAGVEERQEGFRWGVVLTAFYWPEAESRLRTCEAIGVPWHDYIDSVGMVVKLPGLRVRTDGRKGVIPPD